jgi:phosphate starvation-inducible PhoH-like protein
MARPGAARIFARLPLILSHVFEPPDNRRLAHLCGALDAHLHAMEAALAVVISRRDTEFRVDGAKARAERTLALLQLLYERARHPIPADEFQLLLVQATQDLNREARKGGATTSPQALAPATAAAHVGQAGAKTGGKPGGSGNSQAGKSNGKAKTRRDAKANASPKATLVDDRGGDSVAAARRQVAKARRAGELDTERADDPPQARRADPDDATHVVLHTRRADLRGRSPNQLDYLANIRTHDITIGVGPAGTGKTFLAVACAVDALERSEVQRIVLTRPAVEAGERLGFLPGDLAQKVDPYLRPLYDALYDLMGLDRVTKAFEKGLLEIAPLAFMRGRTLNHAFVILDEAQNTTPEQMKMFLTRIGFGSRAVVTGDVSQIDLPKGSHSGLVDAVRVLRRTPGIAITHFDASDVVRHPLVARIVEAYDAARSDE